MAATKHVWCEVNTLDRVTHGAPAWLPPAIDRYKALGFRPIVTTSPGTDYLPIYDTLPDDTIYGCKLSNALYAGINDDAGWKRIADGIQGRIDKLRAQQSGPVNFWCVLEGETLLQRHYWQSADPAAFRAEYDRRLRALPACPYIHYPGFLRDYYDDFFPRLDALIATVKAALPTVYFVDSEFAYQPINPTWSFGARTLLKKYASKPTYAIVYTEASSYIGSGFSRIGWTYPQIKTKLADIAAVGRNPLLYPGSSEAKFTAPLAELEK